ncbi:RGS domain-containing protein [Pilobolus umbonatus]|nr:RGS domain-containing protein [Pilobolus umbonatus]
MLCHDLTLNGLELILDDPDSEIYHEFAAYLHQSYCIENLSFWIATQQYRKDYQDEQSKKDVSQQCEDIINIFIRPNSSQEINIPCDMRQSILVEYHHDNTHPTIFSEASEAVLELMRVNSFLPWLILSQQQNKQKNHGRALTSSFSFSDKWNLMKLKQNKSRRSCSSLDTVITDYRESDLVMTLSPSTESVPSVNQPSRYRTLLQRVKKSFMIHSPIHHQRHKSTPTAFTLLADNSTTSLSSLPSSWTWKKNID